MTMSESAADRWTRLLGSWALPPEILAQAPTSPWAHDPATFAVDDTLDRNTLPAQLAREVLPASDGSVLDVGCGGGRSSLALAPPATHLIGFDENPRMLEQFAVAAAAAGVAHHEVQGRWPHDAHLAPIANVVVCHHVFYNVPDLAVFAAALTAHARLAVVAVLPPRHPLSSMNAAWKHFWNLERPGGPTDADAVAVLRELGLEPEVVRAPRGTLAAATSDPAAQVAAVRRRLCLHPDRDDEIAAYLAEHPPAWSDEVVVLRWPGGAVDQ
jgi:SAM-dependent methyltransferase